MEDFHEVLDGMKAKLADLYEKAGLMGMTEEDKDLLSITEQELKGIWTKLGTEGLNKLMVMGVLKREDVFLPPPFVHKNPIDESKWDQGLRWWWEVVDDIFPNKPDLIWKNWAPNYSYVVTEWKKKLADKLGFMPTPTKDKTMTQQIREAILEAAKRIVAVTGALTVKQQKEIGAEGKPA
jgi:hypothetical protein